MPVPTSTISAPPAASAADSAAAVVETYNSNIWVAAGEGDLASVQHLLDTNTDLTPTSPDDFSYTPVHAAASYSQHEVLEYLLKHPRAALYKPPAESPSGTPAPTGAANVQDSDGDTPLFVCESVETARLLVEQYGADPKHRNLEGKTAAQSAYENDALEVAEYLRSLTGEPEPVDEEEDYDDEDGADDEEYDDEDAEEQEHEDGEENEAGAHGAGADAQPHTDASRSDKTTVAEGGDSAAR